MRFARSHAIPIALAALASATACTSPTASPEAPAPDSTNAAATASTPDAMTTDPGLVHQVYFWLDPAIDEAARRDFVDGPQGMRSLAAAPSVRRVIVGEAGRTPTREVTDNSFDYMLVLWFDDVAGHDAYQVDPVHLAFVGAHEAKFRTVKVFDAEVL